MLAVFPLAVAANSKGICSGGTNGFKMCSLKHKRITRHVVNANFAVRARAGVTICKTFKKAKTFCTCT